MSEEKPKTSPETIELTEVTQPPQPAGPRDWDGHLIEVGDTVHFNMLDQGLVMGEAEDGRIRIRSREKSSTKERPWGITWLIPPGLLKKKKPKDDVEAKKTANPTSRGHCNR